MRALAGSRLERTGLWLGHGDADNALAAADGGDDLVLELGRPEAENDLDGPDRALKDRERNRRRDLGTSPTQTMTLTR